MFIADKLQFSKKNSLGIASIIVIQCSSLMSLSLNFSTK